MNEEGKLDKIVSLCKRRGFVFPGSEIYGGIAGIYDYGPLGVELRHNIKQYFWDKFIAEGYSLDDLDHEEIRRTVKDGVDKNRIAVEVLNYDVGQILRKLELLDDNQLTLP